MKLMRITERLREVHGQAPLQGAFYRERVQACLPELTRSYGGQADLVYIDPPFFTGKRFDMRRQAGGQTLAIPSYTDRWTEADFYECLRTAIQGAHDLLSEEGSFFLHIDYRTHAQLRILTDEIFKKAAFTNEIIWAYQSGGRAVTHFSRKHDTLLYYRKTPRAIWRPEAISVARETKNHMKRSLDETGRAYRSIRSGGKEYRYYEEDTVCPGDVWSDISHLQQRDPERTGFETQKPLKLLERIVACASREDGLVIDLFAGSGTTLDAARRLGRRFVGADPSGISLELCRKRLATCAMALSWTPDAGLQDPDIAVTWEDGDGRSCVRVVLEDASVPGFSGRDGVAYWAIGTLGDGVRIGAETYAPKLAEALTMDVALAGAGDCTRGETGERDVLRDVSGDVPRDVVLLLGDVRGNMGAWRIVS